MLLSDKVCSVDTNVLCSDSDVSTKHLVGYSQHCTISYCAKGGNSSDAGGATVVAIPLLRLFRHLSIKYISPPVDKV